MKNALIVGATSGMIVGIIKNIPNIILYKLGIVNYSYIILAASIHFKNANFGISEYIIGIITDTLTAGILGILIFIIMQIFKFEKWYIKSIILGGAVWLFMFGLVLNLPIVHANALDITPISRIISFIFHQLFVFSIIWLIKNRKEN